MGKGTMKYFGMQTPDKRYYDSYITHSITTVINVNSGQPYDVYIGRGTIFGNPFKVGVHGNRKEVIRLYKEMLLSDHELLESIKELSGKVLGCHCKPKACHGDVICEILNKEIFDIGDFK